MKTNDFKVLNKIFQANKMGIDSISYLEKKIKDRKFKKVVSEQQADYELMAKKVETLMSKNEEKLDDAPLKDKVMAWTSVKMNTAMDNSTSHLAEMLIQGSLMGVIEGVKLLNQNTGLNKKVKAIIDEFIGLSEDNIRVLKKYL